MTDASASTPIRSSCHCGAITVLVRRLPEHINFCQCTICRRYGAGWGYYHPDEVEIEKKPDAATRQYIWGSRQEEFHFCDHCGCMCYWWPRRSAAELPEGEDYQMGLNTNNINPELLKFLERRYDYSWLKRPVKSKDIAHPEDLAQY